MYQPIRYQDGHVGRWIDTNNTNLPDNIEYLLLVIIRSAVGEKSNMSQPIRSKDGHLR